MANIPDPFAHVIKKIGEDSWKLLNNKDWLYDQYVVQNKSSRDIAAILGCGKRSVLASLRRLDIKVSPLGRNKSDRAGKSSHLRQMPQRALGKIDNEKWLYSEFILNNKSAPQIGSEAGVSSVCVRRWLRKFNIKKSDSDFVDCCKRRFEEIHGFTMNSEENMKLILSRLKSETIQTNKGGIVRCHSGWEKVVANRLDIDPEVTSFGKDVTRIKYEFNGKQRTYIVDFYVVLNDDREFLVEVKAPKLLDDGMVKAKLKALRRYSKNNNIDFDIIIDPKQEFKWNET